MDLIESLKQIEDQLAELREEKSGLRKEADQQISELTEEIRGFEVMKQSVSEEEFFSKDKSRVEKQLQHFDKEITKRRKRIEPIKASVDTETGKLDQEIQELDATYAEESKNALPLLFRDLCLCYNKRKQYEMSIFAALTERIDRFFKVVEENIRARTRYTRVLANFKSSQDVPERGVEKMETQIKEKVGISYDPKNSHESWMLKEARDIKRQLFNIERTFHHH